MIIGPYGIPCPDSSPPFVIPNIILVPLLGFTKECHRIGYGGGYYDATLKALSSAISIGVGFSEQLCSYLPIEVHDQSLNYIITELGLFTKE